MKNEYDIVALHTNRIRLHATTEGVRITFGAGAATPEGVEKGENFHSAVFMSVRGAIDLRNYLSEVIEKLALAQIKVKKKR